MAAEHYSVYVAKITGDFLRREVEPIPEGMYVPRVERMNGDAVASVLARLPHEECGIVRDVYSCGGCGFPDRIEQVAEMRKLRQDAVWRTVQRFERAVAEARGLI